ncbi:GGDEF domain-containing protein [Legionella drozanskii]|uniref:diguanylate cyclase n=1 Tax=Legionella drozanskii LLAP-1 TaxID=1212489 RepID=A0A0W0SPY9_9GAMM|nr:GGDEF domain-containing protein [Legionella drozanskii]KTC85474.1 sensor histidine kinase [Legionella drozanskii LLAP-1]
MRDFARKSDIVCRYGGEEFIFVMPEIFAKKALQRAKSLREAVGHIHLRYGGVALTQITISIGLATYPKHGENRHDLIAASDLALYKAKNTGRNKQNCIKKNSI